MPKPIFILGKHRSGTTWLANQLCQHSRIAGVTHENHDGIHESAYFSFVYNRYGDLTTKSNFIEFVEVMCASDYFRLVGVTKAYLYSLWPTTYEEVFRTIMDNLAHRKQATFWLEKSPTHSLWADQLSKIYPDAKFISITRNLREVVASSLHMADTESISFWERQTIIFRTVLAWTFYNKNICSFNGKSNRVYHLQYDHMKSDLPKVMKHICNFLEIPFEPQLCERAFAPNSSFRSTKDRHRALSATDKGLTHLWQWFLNLIPLWLMTMSYKLIIQKKRRSLPQWFFSMYPFHEQLCQSTIQSINYETDVNVVEPVIGPN